MGANLWFFFRSNPSDVLFPPTRPQNCDSVHLHHSFETPRLTCGFSWTQSAHVRISLMASILVSGKLALHVNSDRHFTASWNESIMIWKCCMYKLSATNTSGSTHTFRKPPTSTTAATKLIVLTYNVLGGAKRHLDDRLVLIGGCQVEYAEYVLPAGAYIPSLRIYHLGYATHDHIANHWRPESIVR